jgi:hypothetical protein
MRNALAAALLLLISPRASFAECAPRPLPLCAKVSPPGPIVAARILGPVDVMQDGSAYEWRARVERSFRGDLKEEIIVWVESGDLPSPARLSPGDKYLFYLRPTLPDGSPGLFTSLGCGGGSVPLQRAAKRELAFLAQLGRPTADGRISGKLSREERPYKNIRVTATNGSRTFATRTKSDGTFHLSGLPPGAYHLNADLPAHELTEADDDPLELQAHGCAESDLDVQDNTIVRGHITVPAGMRNTLGSVGAFTPEGKVVKGGWVDQHDDYEIHGVPPGDYVIRTEWDETLPRLDAPFLPTYAPATIDIAQARRVHLALNSPVTGVDITIANVVPKEDLVIRARAGERPIVRSSFRVLLPDRRQYLWSWYEVAPNPEGTFSFPVVIAAGTKIYVMGASEGRCATPVLLTTPVTPVTLEYSEEGCRLTQNLSNMLELQASGGPLMTLLIHVSLPDGRPASHARVTFSTLHRSFEADGDGRLELRVSLPERFTLKAEPYSSQGACEANKQFVNSSGPPTGSIELALQGSGCR